MTGTRLLMAGLVLLLANAPAASRAQPGDPRPPQNPVTASSGSNREDVEVLGRLLDKAFASAYGFPASFPALGGMAEAHGISQLTRAQRPDLQPDPHFAPRAEGVYLKGCGVVYGLTLPAQEPDPHSGVEPTGPKPRSAWELARRELSGDKMEPDETARAAPRQSLGEVVLRSLAENGHNLRGLPGDERVTVAVTFRGTVACATCHGIAGGGPGEPSAVRTASAWLRNRQPATSPKPSQPREASAPATSMKKEIALGDLHLKQGQWQEAVRTYGQVLASFEEARRKSTPDIATYLAAAEAAGKAAQALENVRNEEAYRRALNLAADYLAQAKRLDRDKGNASPSGAGGVPVPAKMVVSVPKSLLDQVESGAMSFDQFRKAATVELLPSGPAPAAP